VSGLFSARKKHVLLYSTAGEVIWEVGELDSKELVFHPQKRGVLDHGAYYAQKTQLDSKGNRILWGWIPKTPRLRTHRCRLGRLHGAPSRTVTRP